MCALSKNRLAAFCGAVITALALPGANAQSMAATDIDAVKSAIGNYRRAHERIILQDFIDLLSMPNVASNLPDMERNADYIIGELKKRDFTTKRLREGGAPYVYAELDAPGATETVLIYAHFDGQPVIPENWAYPPFTPTLLHKPLQQGGKPLALDKIKGGLDPEARLYARS
ncbi:MAG: hypothetical protein WBM68_05155, partial [Woeseia sp.]